MTEYEKKQLELLEANNKELKKIEKAIFTTMFALTALLLVIGLFIFWFIKSSENNKKEECCVED